MEKTEKEIILHSIEEIGYFCYSPLHFKYRSAESEDPFYYRGWSDKYDAALHELKEAQVIQSLASFTGDSSNNNYYVYIKFGNPDDVAWRGTLSRSSLKLRKRDEK